MKPLPPLAEYLSNQIKFYGYKGSVVVFMGEKGKSAALDLHSVIPVTIYLPVNTSPYNFFWPVLDCEIYLVDTDKSKFSFIRYCAVCLFAYGARCVHFQSVGNNFTFEKGIS